MRRVLTIGLAIIALTFAGSSPVAADGDGQCRQDANDLFILASTAESGEGTRGDFQSDVLFGNEPNMASGAPGGPDEQDPGTQAGNVLATWSPGPFINTGENPPPRNDRTMAFGGGDLQALVRAECNQ